MAESSLFNLNGYGALAGGVVADATGVYVVGTSLAAPALPGLSSFIWVPTAMNPPSTCIVAELSPTAANPVALLRP